MVKTITYEMNGYPVDYEPSDIEIALTGFLLDDMNKHYREEAKKKGKTYTDMSLDEMYKVLDFVDYFDEDDVVDGLIKFYHNELLDYYRDEFTEWYLADYDSYL